MAFVGESGNGWSKIDIVGIENSMGMSRFFPDSGFTWIISKKWKKSGRIHSLIKKSEDWDCLEI